MSQIPIPHISTPQYQLIEQLVYRLLELRGEGPATAELEQELNEHVYRLFDLTREEVGLIERGLGIVGAGERPGANREPGDEAVAPDVKKAPSSKRRKAESCAPPQHEVMYSMLASLYGRSEDPLPRYHCSRCQETYIPEEIHWVNTRPYCPKCKIRLKKLSD